MTPGRMGRCGFAVALVLAGCGEDEEGPGGPPEPVPVASVVIDVPRNELALGDTVRLVATALDAEGDTVSGRPVTWASGAAGVLEVTAAGRVIAHQAGEATITALVDGVAGTAVLTGVTVSFTAIVAGDGVTCGLTSAGRAWCWGNVGEGGLGGSDGDSVFASVPRPAGGSLRFGGLSLRAGGGCGVLLDAAAVCWGTNESGQLGDGSMASRPAPGAVPGLTAVAEVAAGAGHTCARGIGGQVSCWGANDRGQLGDGSYAARPVPGAVPGLGSATGVGVGLEHGCALLDDGSARCWGSDRNNQLGHDTSYARSAPQGVPGFQSTHLAASYLKTCALDQAGQAHCWGHNYFSIEPQYLIGYVPVPVGGPSMSAIASGILHSCGLTAAGAAWCWGHNANGALGNGNTTTSDAPVAVSGGHSFTQIGAGWGFTCALDTAGAAWCWGDNLEGKIGQGVVDGTDFLTPHAVVGGLVFTSLGVGDDFACGLTAAGEAWCWGGNDDSELGAGIDNAPQPSPVPVAGGHIFASLHVGSDWGSCAIEPSGQAWCWGQIAAGDGQPYGEHYTPVAVSGAIAFTTIAPGAEVTCGLDTAGATWCWGDNDAGQLGTDGVTYSWAPVAAAPGRAFVELTAGGAHVCGREAGGATWCWGDGSVGQLGTGIRPDSRVPVSVDAGSGFDSLAVGGSGGCGITGAAPACWGLLHGPGMLGPTPEFSQVTLSPDYFKDFGFGSHGCGLTADGAAWCWGSNSHGQMGIGRLDTGGRSQATAVVGGLQFASITAGLRQTCGITTAGEAYCWGDNAQGQLGAGVPRSTTKVAAPARVEGQP